MAAYVNYEFYTDIYQGSTVPENEFSRLAQRAAEILDGLTFGRIAAPGANNDAVKRACCAVTERVYADEQRGGDVHSESVGSYSVTYRGSSRYASIAARYLADTGLLYRGLP